MTDKSKDPRLNVRVDPATRKRLKVVAAETGKSVTDLVQEWVAQGLAAVEAEIAKQQPPDQGTKGGACYA
jgi:uncharacterized protein (DUF1778 family)